MKVTLNIACDCDPHGVNEEPQYAESAESAVWRWFLDQPDHVVMRGDHVCPHCRTRVVSCEGASRRIADYSERTEEELHAAELACAAFAVDRTEAGKIK
jgi:hypothetical protein